MVGDENAGASVKIFEAVNLYGDSREAEHTAGPVSDSYLCYAAKPFFFSSAVHPAAADHFGDSDDQIQDFIDQP